MDPPLDLLIKTSAVNSQMSLHNTQFTFHILHGYFTSFMNGGALTYLSAWNE